MLGGAKSYIIFTYLKYILINILIFLGLIWFSQVLRILELQQSISTHLIDVIRTTILVLPSFINPLLPFILLLASFFLNYKFNNSNEIIILKQYFSIKENIKIFFLMTFGIFIFYFINNEIFSINMYHKYKVKELEIRNNLKLGIASVKEFHIENDVSIFFEKQINNNFYKVEAIILKDGQFIISNSANIEIKNKNYNIIFYDGERVILNELEKIKTSFDKFIYSIENKEIELLMLDKEHFNTLELLNEKDKEFYYQGHNRIYQYLLTLIIVCVSFRVFFIYANKKNVIKKYSFLFIILLIIQLINSYLIFLLNNNNLNLYYYYIVNFIILSFFSYFILNLNDNN